jgi:hypothetical protein
MMSYSFSIIYTGIPGKQLVTSDCLSRSRIANEEKYDMEDEIEAFVQNILETITTTDQNIDKLRKAQ